MKASDGTFEPIVEDNSRTQKRFFAAWRHRCGNKLNVCATTAAHARDTLLDAIAKETCPQCKDSTT